MEDPNEIRGELMMYRVSAVFPDNKNHVRNVKVMLPRSQPEGSTRYRSNTARIEVDRHVSNLIMIVPNDKDKDQEEAGKGQAELEEPGE